MIFVFSSVITAISYSLAYAVVHGSLSSLDSLLHMCITNKQRAIGNRYQRVCCYGRFEMQINCKYINVKADKTITFFFQENN